MFISTTYPGRGSADRSPVAVFYNMADQGAFPGPGRAYHEGDLMVEVAGTHCPPDASPQRVCWTVTSLVQEATSAPELRRSDRPRPPLNRPLRLGDMISIAEVFYVRSTAEGFAVLPRPPANLIRYAQLPKLF